MKRTNEEWEQLYKMRYARLQKLIDMKAPYNIIADECKLVYIAHRRGLWRGLMRDSFKRFKNWVSY